MTGSRFSAFAQPFARTLDRLEHFGHCVALGAKLARLGTGWRTSARIFIFSSTVMARRPLGVAGRPVRLGVMVEGRPCELLVRDRADLEVLQEVLLQSHYDLPADFLPESILDLGSHIGVSVLYFLSRYPQARIVAVEPDPSSYRLLCVNTADLPRVTAINVALGASDGDALLHTWRENSVVSSLYASSAPTTSFRTEVQTLDTLTKRAGVTEIDLLKIDVEGAEWDIFQEHDIVCDIPIIVGEAHFDDVRGRTLADLYRALPGFEIEVFYETPARALFRASRTASELVSGAAS